MPNFLNVFTVKIGGANVSDEFYTDVEEVVVDTSLNMPGMFSIRLHDNDLVWVDDSDLLAIGKEVEIGAVLDASSGGTSKTIFKGEITALEPYFSSAEGTTMVVRGYDKSHRLHHGAKTRTFLKTTDSGIAQKIAQEVGLAAQVDSTSQQYDFVLQYNQTNYDFLKSRAERIGYHFSVSDGKLNFKKGSALPAVTVTLTYLDNLLNFEPRYTTMTQANNIKVMGWDAKQKRPIVSQKTPLSALNQGGMTSTGGAKAQGSFGTADAVIVDQPIDNADQAGNLADGLNTDISLGYVQAEGICFGHPDVQAGSVIKIEKVGEQFSGKYFVTSATHIYNYAGYETHFSVNGRNPNTLMSLVAAPNGNGQESGRVNGLATALVTNLLDPENRGRVKVKYPWLSDNIESDWIRIAAPMAGKERGMMILPEVDDEVLVAFEHGDIHHPYIVGALWSNTDKPPLANNVATNSGKVVQRVFKTRQGHIVTFNDKDGEEQVSVKSKSGHIIVLDDKSGSENITIKDKTGSNSMVIDSVKNSMTIKVGGDFTVEATGKITMKSTGAMNLEATGDTKVKGMNVAVEGTAKSEMKAMQVSVNGSAQAELKGGGMVTVQGGLVKIN